MKEKIRHIVGIILSAIFFIASGYGSFLTGVFFALALDMNGEFSSDTLKLMALFIACTVVAIVTFVFLVLSIVWLVKAIKKEKQASLDQPTTTEEIAE